MEITPDFLRPYFTGNKKHLAYKDSVHLYDELRIHANGEMPFNLIQTRRPSETEEIFEYRRQIYEPVTMEPLSSIIRSLSKIRRSSDWTIKYDRNRVSPSIADDETLEQYCEYNFPMHTSVTNWAFSILLKNLLIDPNAVILVSPRNTDVAPNEYLEPYPVIYNSNQVKVPGTFMRRWPFYYRSKKRIRTAIYLLWLRRRRYSAGSRTAYQPIISTPIIICTVWMRCRF